MPLNEIDYSKTMFYRLVCKDLEVSDFYIGHTTDFKSRKNKHRKNCKNPNNPNFNAYLYRVIRENGDFENWDMVLIETLKCENRLEALKRERELIEEMKPTLNQLRPYRTEEELVEHRIKQNERKRQDRKDNPEKYKEIDRLKYLNNREHILEREKRRYEENKEYKNEKKKEWYYRTKEEVECECGSKVVKQNFEKHKQTKKHQDYINSLQD